MSQNLVKELEEIDDFSQEVSKSNLEGKVMVIKFSASWCKPCKIVSPYFHEFARLNQSTTNCYDVDVDDATDLADLCEVKSLPTFHLFKDGTCQDQISGCPIQLPAGQLTPADNSKLCAEFVKVMEGKTDTVLSGGLQMDEDF